MLKELLQKENFFEGQLTASKREALWNKLGDLNPADLATEVSELEQGQILALFRAMPKDLAAEVFTYLSREIHEDIFKQISHDEIAALLNEMFVDDAVDVAQELPSNIVRKLIDKVEDPSQRQLINEFLNFPKDSAGSLMTVEFICLFGTQTCAEALQYIRKNGVDKETINTCYVTDATRHLTGIISLRTILLSPEDARIEDVMERNYICAHTHDDREAVAADFRKYDLTAMPVLDTEDRIVGIITSDDIMDVIDAEKNEDIEKMAALTPSEKPYLDTSVWELARNRVKWLLLLMIGATVTSFIINRYNELLSHMVMLAAFLPMLMDTGGNSGNQVSTLIVRDLGNGGIEPHDWPMVFWKELRVGLMCGVVLAMVSFLRIYFFQAGVALDVNIVVSLTLLCAVVFAKLMGCTLPIIAQLCKVDPALMASPLITTIVDAFTLVIYFAIATHLLPPQA
ncbi:MAG: magnesium transporter [Victivallales bacterium]|nr:magnesium transporter [Victivallales bacterium]